MRRIVLLLLLLTSCCQASERGLSLAFDEAPVEQVLQALADYQKLNLVIAPGVEGRMSLRLSDVSWQYALKLVARLSRLTIETEDNVLLVYPDSWQQVQKQREAEQQQAMLLHQPLETRTLPLRYANAEAVMNSLLAERSKLMTERGSVMVDSRTNVLLLRDTQSGLNAVERWVQALDIPVAQVALAAHIVTISDEALNELGIRWRLKGERQINSVLRNPQLAIELATLRPAVSAGFTMGRLNGLLLDLELSALAQENQIEIIASPRLLTAHQQMASIKQGTEIPYEVATGNSGATTIEFKEAVLGMDVTPSVLASGRILLKLRIRQNVPGRNINQGTAELLTIDKQEIETQVILKAGETLVLGGIFQQQQARGERKVPLLGDIPGIGTLFRYRMNEQKRRELVIFITPNLIRDDE